MVSNDRHPYHPRLITRRHPDVTTLEQILNQQLTDQLKQFASENSDLIATADAVALPVVLEDNGEEVDLELIELYQFFDALE